MGLYDNFRLANSNEIPRFVGSAGDEFIKVGQYKQGLYDTNLNQGVDLNTNANEVDTVLAKDKPFADELRNSTQSRIKELVQQGDWENAGPELRQLGQNFANRQREIMVPQIAAQEYRKSLENKEYNLTPEQKNALYAMSVSGYSGLSKNARGQYVGSFNGVSPAKNIDVNERVDKWLKDIAVSKGGTSYEFTSDGDMWITKDGEHHELLPAKQIAGVLNAAKSNDTEYQSFKNMQGRIAGFTAASGINSLDDVPQALRSRVAEGMKKTGYSAGTVYGKLMELGTNDDIDQQVYNYGVGKYQMANQWREHGLKTNEFTLKDHNSDTGAAGPYVFQGPDSKLTNDEKDYSKLQTTVNDTRSNLALAQAEVTKLTKDLQGTLSPTARAQKQSDLTNAQNRVAAMQAQTNRAEDLMNYSKDVTAQNKGYNDYEDFYTKNKAGMERTIAKSYPNGIMTASGKHVSLDELTRAAVDGRIVGNYEAAGSAVGGPTQRLTGVTVSLKDGTKVPIAGSKGTEIFYNIQGALDKDAKNIRDFQKDVKEQHANNVKDFSIQSANIQIPDKQREDIGTMLRGMKDGIRFSEPGQLKGTDAPDNFSVTSYGLTATGDDVKFQVEERDKDGKPTGKYYDAVTKGNASTRLAQQYGASKDVYSRQIADAISPGSGARQLMGYIPGNKIPVGEVKAPGVSNADPIPAYIQIIRHKDKTISYELVDESGRRLADRTTDNVIEAGAWIDAIQEKPTYVNGQKLVIDKGRTKNPR
jgi:hypothetical protein